MRLLHDAAQWEGIGLSAGFAIVTMWKLLQSGSFAGLVRSDDGTLSPGRIQLLVLTVLAALQFLLATLHDPSHLPQVPSSLLVGLGGSQAVYLGAKAWTIFGPKQNK